MFKDTKQNGMRGANEEKAVQLALKMKSLVASLRKSCLEEMR